MGISVNTSKQQVTASVNDETVSATVSAGFGSSGAAGQAATIAVGTVTTGAAGSSASVTNAGTSSAAVFNFTIPAGATGPQGATGPAGTTTWAGITDKPTLGTAAASDATSFAAASHAHGNLTSAGLIGSNTASGQIVVTTTGGALTTSATIASTQVSGLGTAATSATTDFAAATHTHAASAVTSGTFDIARIPVGTTSTTVAAGNDARFTDTRTPTDGSVTDAKITSGGLSASSINWVAIQPWAANTAYAKGDLVSNAGIAYRRSAAGTSGSTFNTANWQQITPSEFVGSQITSGTVAVARLGSGTASSSTWLRGDGSWQSLPSGGTKTVARFDALDNQPPATNFATLDTRNSIAVLDFDDATKETAVFAGVITEAAALGSGLLIRIHWMATSATSNACRWEVALERSNTDLDSDSFDTVATAATTTNGTSGIVSVTEITLTTIDGVTAGDLFRLRVARDAANAADTMTGDAELVAVEVRSAA